MTFRCFVIAWRVMGKPTASFVIDIGPSSDSRDTRRRRLSSPSAVKTGAVVLGRVVEIFRDKGDHHAPALLVRGERRRAPCERDFALKECSWRIAQ
jgi:hypothetical protein